MIARLAPLLLLCLAPLDAASSQLPADTVRADGRLLRVDTVAVGDSILRVDSILLPQARGGVALGGGGGRAFAAADTIEDAIRLRGLTIDILRAPMSLDAAPFAISVLDDELWTTGRSNGSIEEALQGLPGLQIHNRFNDAVGERISIRGYGGRSEFGVRGVKILVDDIPATLPDGQSTLDHLDLGSLGRAEALRGPGSALYGNAAGGVLHLETRRPADSPLRQEARVVEGDQGYRRQQATTSGSVGDTGYLVNLARYEFGGYRHDPLATPGTGAGAGPGRYGSARRDHLNAQVHAPLLGGRTRVTVNAMQLDAEDPGSLTREQVELGDRRAFPLNVRQGAGRRAIQRQVGVHWEGSVGDRNLELAGYGIDRTEVSSNPNVLTDLQRAVGGVRATVRSEAEGEEGRLWWAVGADLDVQRDDRIAWTHFERVRASRLLDQRERVRAGAVFLQAMLPINSVLDVLTGLRYDRIGFAVHDRMRPGAPGDAEGSRTVDSASPSIGVHAGFHRAFGMYVNLSTAFETPTTTELGNRPGEAGGFDFDLEPQVGITTEVGGRGVLGPVLAWEAVFFHTTLHNELVPYEDLDAPGRRYFRNSARSTREGWEIALQMTPDPNIRGRLVLSTNDARFRSYTVDEEEYGGNRVPGLAPHKIEGILRVGPGRWFTEVRGALTGPIQGNDANEPEAVSPAHRLVDVRAGANDLRLPGFTVSPFAGVTNVFDRRYNTSVVANAHDGRYFEPGPGRAFYLGANVAFEL